MISFLPRSPKCISVAVIAATLSSPIFAEGIQTLETIEVKDRTDTQLGVADSATQGTVTAKQLENRPILRPGELLETVPGLIVTQHSGDGKANQYFLRGFNLDHGTDLAVSVDGMPINMPTHAHGQGYTDLNFLIPELVQNIQYKKGPYYADVGDFGAAGAVQFKYADILPHSMAEITGGSFGYARTLLAGSPQFGAGKTLYALEISHNNGPWDNSENFQKLNGILCYSQGNDQNGFSLSGMAYHAQWNATDQIPQRAIDSGLRSRWGSLNPTDGGDTHRYSLSSNWHTTTSSGITKANLYLIDYALNLFSDFTYFLDDPINGDQFAQKDRRITSGGSISHTQLSTIAGHDIEQSFGLQLRNDNIANVGLYKTVDRTIISTASEAHVLQSSVSPYYQAAIQISPHFRTVAGLRYDAYQFNVRSNLAANSGNVNDHIFSPKLSLIFGPFNKTELYLNLGRGFHSNDARGTTLRADPVNGATPVNSVNPLVRAFGKEIGIRTSFIPDLQSTLSLWQLDIDSELRFAGDAGTTEASRPSRRTGIEWTNTYKPNTWLSVDADLAISRSRFRDDSPAGNVIPDSIEKTLSIGLSATMENGWFGSTHVRYFGPRPLIEDNSQRSPSSTLVYGKVGYHFNKAWQASLDVYNLFNRRVNDIDYFYASQLKGEAAPVNDAHIHPAEPRSVRLSVTHYF